MSDDEIAPPEAPLSAAEFASVANVSRETLTRLSIYIDLLSRWQSRINLVGPNTLRDPWRRHILDCAQILPLLAPGTVLDIGTGAGFPGLVLAIMGAEFVHLVESDKRKGAFLAEAIRLTQAPARLHSARIETIAPFPVTNVTARAVAPLAQLLDWACPFLGTDTTCLFMKGAQAELELTQAQESWMMRVERHPSLSDPRGVLLKIKGIIRGVEQR